MASKKSPAQILKAKGLIPGDWNLRKLSPGQKSWVTKQSKRYAAVIRDPGSYTTAKVPKGQKASFKRSGILRKGESRILVKGDRVKTGPGWVQIYRADRDETQRIYSTKDVGFDKLLTRLRRLKVRANQYWMASIGNGPPIGALYESIEDLEHYLRNVQWRTPSAMDHVNLVLVTNHAFTRDDLDEE